MDDYERLPRLEVQYHELRAMLDTMLVFYWRIKEHEAHNMSMDSRVVVTNIEVDVSNPMLLPVLHARLDTKHEYGRFRIKNGTFWYAYITVCNIRLSTFYNTKYKYYKE